MARNITIAGVVIDLIAESAQYLAELRRTNQATRRWSRDVSRSFDNAAKNLTAMAAGYLTVSTAIGAMKKSMADAKEIENMARLAQTSVEDFQAMTYAVDTVGVSAEKLGDMTKDVNEKLGEFIDTGGGGFKDFFEQVAPKVGLTAKELQNLSGPEVLLRMQQAMEAANVPLKQQSFYLESVANDATLLIPLLENNGQKLHELTGEYDSLNVAMSQMDIENLKEMDKQFKNISRQLSSAFAQAVVGAADQIKWFTDTLSAAIRGWGLIFDSFSDNPKFLSNIQTEIDETRAKINDLTASLVLYKKYGGGGVGAIWDALTGNVKGKAEILAEIDALTKKEQKRMQDYAGAAQSQIKLPTIVWPEQKKTPDAGDASSPALKKTEDALKKAHDAAVEATQQEEEAFQKSNQRILNDLQNRYGMEQALLRQSHIESINSIQDLVLTEDQVKAAGYESMDALQADFLKREIKQFDDAMDLLKEKSGTSVSEATRNFQTLADLTGGSVDDIKSATTGWANEFSSSMANMVTKGKLDFSSLAESIINDLIRIAIQAQITKPLMDAMGLGGSTAGGSETSGAAVSGAKATGGPVMRGSTYLVGEKGPELFTASNSGSIVPNGQLGGGGTVVNIYNEAGADVQTNTRQTPQGDVIEIMLKQVEGRMNEQINRGQGLAQTLEGRYSLTRNSF